MIDVVFDTSILVDHLRGLDLAKELVHRVEKTEVKGFISSITEAELLAWRECNNIQVRKSVEKLIGLFTKVLVDNAIAQQAGEFRRIYGAEMPDAIIAATAFSKKCKIWTKNIVDFKKINRVESEEPY